MTTRRIWKLLKKEKRIYSLVLVTNSFLEEEKKTVMKIVQRIKDVDETLSIL